MTSTRKPSSKKSSVRSSGPTAPASPSYPAPTHDTALNAPPARARPGGDVLSRGPGRAGRRRRRHRAGIAWTPRRGLRTGIAGDG